MKNTWIITEGKTASLDLSNICEQPVSKTVMEYRISEIAKYMLSPNPITVEEKIIGCRIKYRKSRRGGVLGSLKALFSLRHTASDQDHLTEEILSLSKIGMPSFKDEDLNRHFIKINELLRMFDPVQKKITGLDRDRIEDVMAVCEDIGGNRYQLNLKGSINEKLQYISNSVAKRVNVVFNKSYLSKGLFEMRGYRFELFNPDNHYKLVRFMQNSQPRYCVLNMNYQFEFWVGDSELVSFMHILEQSIRTDPKLKEAITQCMKQEANPLKLFFSNKLEQSYTENYLPMTYRKVLTTFGMNQVEKAAIANMLNNHQNIVSFNYVPRSDSGKKKMCINISVLHDIRALDPIKSRMPELYSEINKQAPSSDAGKLYLLDSMRGYQYV